MAATKSPRLADADHPSIRRMAERLTIGREGVEDKLASIFLFVRDGISFGFPKNGDLVKASETLRDGVGQCNTKTTLFLALCRASGIPARAHYSLIDKAIQKGLFSGLAYALMPDEISHSWIEALVKGQWKRIDAFINDKDFYHAGKEELKKRAWKTGFSIACSRNESSIDLSLGDERFVQMDAVTADHGIWDDPADYFGSELYRNRPGWLKTLLYRLMIGGINRRVERLRKRRGDILVTGTLAKNEGKAIDSTS